MWPGLGSRPADGPEEGPTLTVVALQDDHARLIRDFGEWVDVASGGTDAYSKRVYVMLRDENSQVTLRANSALDMAVQLRLFDVRVVALRGPSAAHAAAALALEAGLILASARDQDTVVVLAPPASAVREELESLRLRHRLRGKLQVLSEGSADEEGGLEIASVEQETTETGSASPSSEDACKPLSS